MQPSSFALILETAAAKAWSRSRRTFASCPRPVASTDGPSALAHPEAHVKRRAPLRVRARKTAASPAPWEVRPVSVRPISPKQDDFCRQDPGRVADTVWSEALPADAGTPVRMPPEAFPSPAMPFPVSTQSLYRKLLSMTSNPPFSIRAAIDYYFNSPTTLHSTKSFNLLIGLALRSASFAPVGHLFSAMRAESIPANMETWKLHVRWLVRSGRWNDAWKRVLEVTGEQSVPARFPSKPIPLPLWLELFGSQKRGALRHWVVTVRKPDMDATLTADWGRTAEVVSAGCCTSLDAGVQDTENPTSLFWKQLIPRPCQQPCAVEQSRYRVLMQASPPLVSSNQVMILPRTILIITRTMYQVGQRTLALSTALSYVKSLPPRLRRYDRRRVLDLVNFHLSMVAWRRKPSLKLHFIQRRILWQFLHARPDLTPSSTTLFLLLAPLRSCRRSGTLAIRCLHIFEKKWGPRIQSRLVRRRVARLALKEGRLDIVAAMIKLESRCRVSNDPLPRTVYIPRRIPWRTLFGRQGAENRRWHLIVERYRRQLALRSGLQAS